MTRPGARRFRRAGLWAGAVAAVALALGWWGIDAVGGASTRPPAAIAQLSAPTRVFLARHLDGLDPARRLDHHAHVAGLGAGASGCEVNPRSQSLWHPIERLKFAVYLSASGVTDPAAADGQFVARLLDLVRHHPLPGRLALLAFDHRYRPDGSRDADHSEFHVPNDYVLGLARAHPDRFVPVGSVHPFRQDALAELDRLADRGVRMIKWLPNAMGIDPAAPRLDAYYDKLRARRMILLTHTGLELAVEAEADQAFGNPLRLRRPLSRGVQVIAAHSASLGDDEDLDAAAGPDGTRPSLPSHTLFLRLMDEPAWKGLLFGEISAATLFKRADGPLRSLLGRPDLHARLVDGSDYPLPAVNILIHLRQLRDLGYLRDADLEPLRDLYAVNPLLFDLVLKRALRHPDSGQGFPPAVFHAHPDLRLEP